MSSTRFFRGRTGTAWMAFAALAFGLSACGGGGGGGSNPLPVGGGGGPSPTPVSSPVASPSAKASTSPGPLSVPAQACASVTPAPGGGTTLCGVLVDDQHGLPLAGAPVKLMPWGNGPGTCGPTPPPLSITPENDGCPTPMPSPQVTTAPNGTFVLGNVPTGHDLLVIGTDAVPTIPPGYAPETCPPGQVVCATPTPVPGTPYQATVHDNITVTATNAVQVLIAPTLPTVPQGYIAPSWEVNGEYRLATLNALTEMPCVVAWEYLRAQDGFAGSSVDEWLLENARAANAYSQVAPAGTLLPALAPGPNSSGGVSCDEATVTPVGVPIASQNARMLWFAGQYLPYGYNGNTTASAMGFAQILTDPRSYAQASPYPTTWP